MVYKHNTSDFRSGAF